MHSVAWAFGWEVWGRHRVVVLLGLAYLLGLIVLFQVAAYANQHYGAKLD